MDPANQDAYGAESVRCFGCQAKDYTARQASDSGMDTDGLYYVTLHDGGLRE